MNYDEWKKRIATRSDITMNLVHLTKPNETTWLHNVLLKILKDKRINGSTTTSGFIVGDKKAVCFQETPLYSLAQNVYYEQSLMKQNKIRKQRYYGAGLIFEKSFIYKNGGRPVIYDKTIEAKSYLPSDQYWRIVNLDLSDDNAIVDWTHEREWRVPGDLQFNLSDISIVVPNQKFFKTIIKLCKRDGIDLISETKSVISLKELFY